MSRPSVITSSTLLLVAALGLSACSTASVDEAKQAANATPSADVAVAQLNKAAADLLPADVKAKGVLTVGTDPTYPPFESYAPDNKTVIGLDADLAKALGETLGVKVEMVPATFDTILPGLASHKYDIGISAFNVTSERKKNADFAIYQLSGSGLAVKAGNPKKLNVDPMTLCGTKVGGEKGTTQGIETLPAFSKKCTDAGKPAIDIQLFPTQDEANTALASGRVDSILSGLIGMGYASKLSGGAFQLASDESFNPTPVGMAMAKGSPLTPAVVAAVKSLMTSETYKSINAKYGLPQSVAVAPDAVDASGAK
ncbi:ABC transporter substrate-binding protein [Arthrobacter alkaliphilus]|uniref:ABC transporter substrate-binding protein n=1 Tax=Arthrobacter alkaliphilus TaxID=369936 RepID=UPI001F201078|nr:ABC transporter substrate-binding protein [Arthrobacter alkaliphilus]